MRAAKISPLVPQRYVVGWWEGVIKIGYTSNGRERWGKFLNRGADLLDLSYYPTVDHALEAELWLQEQVGASYPRAFSRRKDAATRLSNGGSGYLECYRVPASKWPELIELAGAA